MPQKEGEYENYDEDEPDPPAMEVEVLIEETITSKCN